MTTQSLFEELYRVTDENIEFTNSNFSGLTEEQLNWKPSKESWNILEIFSHLDEFARYYHNAFSKKVDTTRFTEPKEIFLSSPMGKSAWKSMKLGNARNVKRKFKAQRTNNPSIVPSIVKTTAIEDFVNYQNELKEIFERAKTINVRKSKIGISISKIVRLRFGDALLFVVYHNQRHIQQAINLLNHKKFPR